MTYEDLTSEHLNLPYALAAKYAKATTNLFDELVSKGLFTLLDCVNKFDERRKCKFGTFAYTRIRWSMIRILKPDKGSWDERWANYTSLDTLDVQGVPLWKSIIDPTPNRCGYEDRQFVRYCLAKSSQDARQVFIDYHGWDVPSKDIASRRGVSYRSVQGMLKRCERLALSRAKEQLDEYE